MANFPTSIDSYTTKQDGVDYPQAAHINDLQSAVVALETKVGADNSAVATSVDYLIKNTTAGHDHDGSDSKKIIATNLNVTGLTASQLLRVNSGGSAVESSGKTVPTGDIVGTSDSQTLTGKTLTSPVLNTGVSGTAILDEDDFASDSATKVATQQSIKAYITSAIATAIATAKSALFPVGAIYTSVSAINPGTSLGFGTWTAFGAGRCLVGLDAGQTEFDVVEETGGAKTHTLTTAEMPAHTHTYEKSTTQTNALSYAVENANNDGLLTTTNTSSAGSGSAHNNLQPYIVVYFWKRTA
jgi:hypothetical protein